MSARECWLLWHGGSSYELGTYEEDVEHFDSIRALVDSFERRLWDPYYPCVTSDIQENGGQSGWVFFSDPNDEANGPGDPYPDRIICHGPRGGVRLEYA